MRFLTFFFCFTQFTFLFGNQSVSKLTSTDYITNWSAVAVNQMTLYRIPASITLAQGLLESGNGNSKLAVEANNHFGIKCHDWTGETIFIDDDAEQECFRKYETAEASFVDHSLFLTTKKRYEALFQLPIDDYKSWAEGLKTAGYATLPTYADRLIELIERLNLSQYDEKALTKNGEELLAQQVSNNKHVLKIDATALTNAAHQQKENNTVRFIIAKKGDTYYKIAQEFDLALWQLYAYNSYDEKKEYLAEGDIVYIEPKKARLKSSSNSMKKSITLKQSQTVQEISQKEAIKVGAIIRKNKLNPTAVLQKGQVIELN
jgi:LysM repeat protein